MPTNISSSYLWPLSLRQRRFDKRATKQPRSQVLSFCHLGETLAAAGHVPPRFWEVNLIVTVRGVGKGRVCSVLKLQLWVMKFTVNLQQEIVKRTLKLIFIPWRSTLLSGVELQFKQVGSDFIIDLPKKPRLGRLAACAAWRYL